MNIKTQSLPDLSALEQDLLTLLLHNKQLYGLQFINAFEVASSGQKKLGVGSLYPTLHRLQRKKFVISKWGDDLSGPRRKYYSITSLGKKVLQNIQNFRESLSQWEAHEENELLSARNIAMDEIENINEIEIISQ